jgi:hypothetical protein
LLAQQADKLGLQRRIARRVTRQMIAVENNVGLPIPKECPA